MEEEKIKCIYYIKDLRTDKIIYVGQTTDFKKRKQNHFCSKKQPIDLHIQKCGRDNFIMEIFDIDCTNLTADDMKQKEDELIIYYDTINNGFNKVRSGQYNQKEYNKQFREEHKEYIKKINKQYYQKNKEYFKKINKQYREEHKEYFKEYRLKYKNKS